MREPTKFEVLRYQLGTLARLTAETVAGLPPWFVLLGMAIGAASVVVLDVVFLG
jgi:hypothetical protein